MSLSLGSASLKLSANAGALTAGLDQAYGRITSFRANAQKSISTLSLGPLASSLPMIGGIGALFGAATMGANLFSDAVGRTKELAEIGRDAKSIGIASDQFMGLSAAAKNAGVEQKEFGALLQKSSAKIAGGSADAALALSKIGLSISDLKGMSPDQQFYAIADGLSKVQDSGTKAFVAQKLYEEQGLKLLPVLGKGSEALKSFVEQQKKMGAALGDKDMAAIERAKAAIPKIQGVFDGLFNKVTVAMSPMIVAVGDVFSKILARIQPVFDWIARAAEAYFPIVSAIFSEIVDAVGEALDYVASAFSEVFAMAGGMPSIGEVIQRVFMNMGIAAAYVWDVVKAIGGAFAITGSYAVTAMEAVVKALASVLEVAAKLPESLGGNTFKDAAESARKIGDGMGASATKMEAWGKKQLDGFGGSAKAAEAWFNKLKNKKEEINDIKPPPMADFGPVKYLSAGAVVQGSKEDITVRAKWETQIKTQTEQQRANALLGDIKAGIAGVQTAVQSIPALPQT